MSDDRKRYERCLRWIADIDEEESAGISLIAEEVLEGTVDFDDAGNLVRSKKRPKKLELACASKYDGVKLPDDIIEDIVNDCVDRSKGVDPLNYIMSGDTLVVTYRYGGDVEIIIATPRETRTYRKL